MASASGQPGTSPWADGLQPGTADTSQALLILDGQQRIVMANPAAWRLLGLDGADALLGRRLSQFVAERAQDEPLRSLRDWMSSPVIAAEAGWQTTLIGRRGDGGEFPLALSLSRLATVAQPGFAVLLRDLSEDGRRPSHGPAGTGHPMRSFLELAPTAIWIVEGETIVFANRACARLFGADDHRQLLGRTIYSLLRPASHALVRRTVEQALAQRSLRGPVPLVSESIAGIDGQVREVEIAMAALPDHGHTTLQMVITDNTERNRSRRAQAHHRRELRYLAAGLIEAREAERQRIARELHDELGQRLTLLKLELAGQCSGAVSDDDRAQRLPALLTMIDDAMTATRRIATELRPAVLDDLGLGAAIRSLVAESTRLLGMAIDLRLPDEDPPVAPAIATALYRAAQEALTNIARHAQADHATIELRSGDQSVSLRVQDNGRGFDGPVASRRGSQGLIGLRERCDMLGGSVSFGNAAQGGAYLRVDLPLTPVAEDSRPADLDDGGAPDCAPEH